MSIALSNRLRLPLRAAYHLARALATRGLHPLRRRRARHLLGDLHYARRILVLCHGNVCRSPYLEHELRRALASRARNGGVDVRSAGFVGPHRAVPTIGLEVASDRGLDLAAHRSQLVDREMLERADLVLVMDARQARDAARLCHAAAECTIVVGDLDPLAASERAIADPWKGDAAAFAASYDRIDRCAAVIARALLSARAPRAARAMRDLGISAPRSAERDPVAG